MPGKFEGCPPWVKQAWNDCLEGAAEYETGHYYVWADTRNYYILWERDDGFVCYHLSGSSEDNAINTAQDWEEADYPNDEV